MIFAKRVAVFFAIVWLVNTRERVYFTIRCFLVMVIFLAFQAMLQAETGLAWGGATLMPGYAEIRVRWHGDWDGPNVFAMLFIVGISFAMEFLFGPYKLTARVASLFVMVVSCVAIFFTNSRGAVLALVGMIALYFKDRFSKPVAIGLVVVLVLGVTALGPSRMSEINTKESSARERSWAWEQGLNLLQAHPLLGVGRDQFRKKIDSGLVAHNNYVQNFSELGLMGFFVFIALMWCCGKSGYLLSQLKRPDDPHIASLGRMILGSVSGYAIVTFFVVMELDLLYFLMGICMAIYQTIRCEAPELPALALTRLDTTGVVAVMGGLLIAVWLIAVKSVV